MSEDFNAKGHLEEWELAKKLARTPQFEELRSALGLRVERYCSLLDIDKATYIKWKAGEGGPSINQKILLRKIYEAAIKRGVIPAVSD